MREEGAPVHVDAQRVRGKPMGKAAAGDPPQTVKLSGEQTGCRWCFGKCRFPHMRGRPPEK